MKVVINVCFGGFSLSPRAVQRLAELQGRQCFFFDVPLGDGVSRKSLTLEEAEKAHIWSAFDIPNPDEVLRDSKPWKEMTMDERKKSSARYDKHEIDNRPSDRADKNLVRVVEELGDAANGSHAELKVVKIPNGVDYEIDEYDGTESIHEKHRSWR